MGATKTAYYSEEQLEMAAIAKALGHPARVAIVEHLLKVNSCICGDIVDELSLAQPTISQHLKELKNAGIIQGEIEGNAICYCVDEKAVKKILGYFNNIADMLKTRNNNCCQIK